MTASAGCSRLRRSGCLLHGGEAQFLRNGILAVPVENYLRALVPGRPPLAAYFPK